jgi:hypothetical protein
VDDFALTPAERALLGALNRRGIRYLVIGLGAAVLQGAPVSTQNLALWLERPGDDAVRQTASDAGGFWIPAFGMRPPGFGGDGLERIDVVLTAHGLHDFESEYLHAPDCLIDDVPRTGSCPSSGSLPASARRIGRRTSPRYPPSRRPSGRARRGPTIADARGGQPPSSAHRRGHRDAIADETIGGMNGR